jgi:hypothetical protein
MMECGPAAPTLITDQPQPQHYRKWIIDLDGKLDDLQSLGFLEPGEACTEEVYHCLALFFPFTFYCSLTYEFDDSNARRCRRRSWPLAAPSATPSTAPVGFWTRPAILPSNRAIRPRRGCRATPCSAGISRSWPWRPTTIGAGPCSTWRNTYTPRHRSSPRTGQCAFPFSAMHTSLAIPRSMPLVYIS